MSSSRKAIVLNSSHPELDHIASELIERGALRTYFGRYFPSNGRWEKFLSGNPLTGKFFQSGPGRRTLPEGFGEVERYHPGDLWDFASGLVSRKTFGRSGELGVRALLQQRDRAVVRSAVRHWNGEDAVLANHTIADTLFALAEKKGVPRILNYPIAHHRYSRQLLLEEAELHPEFATDLKDQLGSEDRFAQMDVECELASSIIVGSSFVKESFVASGIAAEKVFVSSYGVNVADFVSDGPSREDGVFRALWVGQISQRKGIKYLLEAWKSFAGPATELIVAGYFPAGDAAFKPYADLFQAVGFLDKPELRALFCRCDVLVLPTLIEGMPLSVLQAMAAGLPVIVTNHGLGDVVRDGIDGFIVPIRDPGAIAERLEYLRAHPEVRAEMGRNASQRAREFTWQRFRSETGDYIVNLLR